MARAESGRVSHESSRLSVGSQPMSGMVKKNFQRISKIELGMFDGIEDPDEREQLFAETIERMKSAIEDLHLKVMCVVTINRMP